MADANETPQNVTPQHVTPQEGAPTDERPPVPPASPIGPLITISDAASFDAALESLAEGNGPIAVDAERANGFRYSSRAYLVQVFRRGAGTFLFDAPALPDFSPLQSVIGDEEWVLHAASQDLPCLRELGLEPGGLFDTELGARLAGFERVGLAAVVERLLGLHLKKEHSAADWSRRPIPVDWLTYAALDVELLVDLRDALERELDAHDKLDIAHQEFDAVLARAPKPAEEEPWRRLSGLHTIKDPKTLAIARELWRARDAYAREIDGAPGRLIPDASLVTAAKSGVRSKGELAGLSSFTGRTSRTQLDRWWQAIERGRAATELPRVRVPHDGPPPPRFWRQRDAKAAARLEHARPAVQVIAESLHVPNENLLTPDVLRRVAWSPPDPVTPTTIADALARHGARPWQIDAVAQTITLAFADSTQSAEEPSEPTS